MNKIIFTDADGCLLDWEKSFHEWMNIQGYEHIHADVYDIGKQFGLPSKVAKEIVIRFNESVWINDLVAFRDAKKGINKLVSEGYKFVVITSLSDDPHAYKARLRNLHEVFGEEFLKELVCIGCGDDKDEILAAYVEKFPAAKFWIEDKMENVIAGEKLGLTGILIEHRHNSEKHGHNSMFSWAEIVDYIMENDNTT
jgi:FMN phosphatase YigB (HAD superfamily)